MEKIKSFFSSPRLKNGISRRQMVMFFPGAIIGLLVGKKAEAGTWQKITDASNSGGAGATATGIQTQLYTCFTTAGTATAYTLTPSPALTAYSIGTRFSIRFHAIPGPSPTINISGLGAKSLKAYGLNGSLGVIGNTGIPVGRILDIIYDGTDFIVGNVNSAATYNVNVLLVAGGGSGGGSGGSVAGGGGGGGVYSGSITCNIGSIYTVVVGAGGSTPTAGTIGNSGSNSTLTSATTAIGGGGGGYPSPGAAGGSGGGGSYGVAGGAGTAGQGYAGGAGAINGTNNGGGGGGGGAGAVGSGGGGGVAGPGGAGIANTISGSSVYYAGGGGGAGNCWQGGAGGNGGGGIGGTSATSSGGNGVANTGGGGGGNNAGGSGVVILAVPTIYYTGIYSGAPVVTTTSAGAVTVLTFNSSGSYTA